MALKVPCRIIPGIVLFWRSRSQASPIPNATSSGSASTSPCARPKESADPTIAGSAPNRAREQSEADAAERDLLDERRDHADQEGVGEERVPRATSPSGRASAPARGPDAGSARESPTGRRRRRARTRRRQRCASCAAGAARAARATLVRSPAQSRGSRETGRRRRSRCPSGRGRSSAACRLRTATRSSRSPAQRRASATT